MSVTVGRVGTRQHSERSAMVTGCGADKPQTHPGKGRCGVSAESGGTGAGPRPRPGRPRLSDAARAAELEALRRDFPRYRFETHVLGGQEHYTARRRPGEYDARPYSVTTADLSRLRRELGE